MSELYDINEVTDCTFTLSLKIIDRYQREYPVIQKKINSAEYQKGYFYGG